MKYHFTVKSVEGKAIDRSGELVDVVVDFCLNVMVYNVTDKQDPRYSAFRHIVRNQYEGLAHLKEITSVTFYHGDDTCVVSEEHKSGIIIKNVDGRGKFDRQKKVTK